jgi:hypothetical protein
MAKIALSAEQANVLDAFLKEHRPPELVETYLFYIENKYHIEPVLFAKDKTIYQSSADAIRLLEAEKKIWHETEIKFGTDIRAVNEQTKKIYICPFSGKVFGDNTHPNPQDAIYDWVAKCPENTERVGGLRAKRFFVSEDPEMIAQYMAKTPAKQPVTKVVFSSVLSGKLFNSKESVIADFKRNYLKKLTLTEVQNQNRFKIEEHFLKFLQEHIVEDKIASFVEALAQYDQFQPYVNLWVDAEQEQEQE